MHAGAFEAGADSDLASRLDDTGGDAQALGAKLWVPHSVTMCRDVVDALTSFVVGVGMDAKGIEDRIDVAFVEFVAPLLGPLFT